MLFASRARMKDIQQRLGHARSSTTMDIYTHITENTDGDYIQTTFTFAFSADFCMKTPIW